MIESHEYIIPAVVFGVIVMKYVHEYWRGSYFTEIEKKRRKPLEFFARMREGWVDNMHLTGQAACNTTRDYLRVLIFFAGNAILLATIFAGFAAQYSHETASPRELLMLVKLGSNVVIFMVIFFMFFMATRYAVHLHFMINVKEINGKPCTKPLIAAVFNKAHSYVAAGLRLYFLSIPLFAWVFSEWALLVVCPLYLVLVRNFENLEWMRDEIREFETSTPTVTDEASVTPTTLAQRKPYAPVEISV